MYDKLYQKDIFIEAWERIKVNGRVEYIDQVRFVDIEEYGVEIFLREILNGLNEGKYHPNPVKRTYIPKVKDKRRPLGIPAIKDRVIQMAVKIAIEPVFESDFKDCSYGFRVKRDAHQTLDRIRKDTTQKGWWIVDANIKRYFDNVNHEKLRDINKFHNRS